MTAHGVKPRQKPTLILAEDNAALLERLRKFLDDTFEILNTAQTGKQLVETATASHPDVVLADLHMPELNGIRAARKILEHCPAAKVVILTQEFAEAYVLEAFRAGVSAYVLKQSAAAELKNAIHTVLQGGHFISHALGRPADHRFTSRQHHILERISEGKQNSDIASELRLSAATIDFLVNAMIDEIGLQTHDELRQYARSKSALNPA